MSLDPVKERSMSVGVTDCSDMVQMPDDAPVFGGYCCIMVLC